MIPIYRILAPKFFNVQIIFALRIFFNCVVSKFSTRFPVSFFHFVVPRKDPAYRVEYVAVDRPGPGNLWAWDSNVSRWVHCNFVIHVPSKINSNFITTFPNPEGEVPITVSPSINGSA